MIVKITMTLLIWGGGTRSVDGATASFGAPGLDRWMYPHNGQFGSETGAPAFGGVGSAFGDRGSQVLMGFETDAGPTAIPAGRGATNYLITSVKVTAKHFDPSGSAVVTYDPTYDSYKSYNGIEVDADAGRPIELHGLGLRAPAYDRLSFDPSDPSPTAFKETSPYGTRDAFALGFNEVTGAAREVTNNVTGGFESFPWAVGAFSGLNAGESIPSGTTFTFNLDLSDAEVVSYLQASLNAGAMGFAISSIAPASQSGTQTYPRFFTKESTLAGAAPATLEVEYSIVPEPSSLTLASMAACALFVRRRRFPARRE